MVIIKIKVFFFNLHFAHVHTHTTKIPTKKIQELIPSCICGWEDGSPLGYRWIGALDIDMDSLILPFY